MFRIEIELHTEQGHHHFTDIKGILTLNSEELIKKRQASTSLTTRSITKPTQNSCLTRKRVIASIVSIDIEGIRDMLSLESATNFS